MGIFGKPSIDKLKSKGDVKGLHEALVSPASSPELRVDAAIALLDLDATDVLREALKDLRAEYVEQILKAFVSHGNVAAESTDRRHQKAWPILIELWFHYASSPSYRTRQTMDASIAAALRQMPSAVAALVDSLSDGTGRVRSVAIRVLEGTADAEVEAALAAALVDDLRDPYFAVRRDAIEALSRLGRAEAVEPIASLLADPDPSVQPIAAHALARFGDSRGRDVLVTETESNDAEARARAIASLGNIQGADEIPMLVKLLSDPSLLVSEPAARRLAELEWAPAMDETGAYYFLARGEVEECLRIGAKATSPLMARLPDAWICMTNYRELLCVAGEVADSRIVPMLQNLVKKEQEAGGYGREERIALAMSAITSIRRRLPEASPEWIELMNLATLPLGEETVVDQKLDVLVTCPSCDATMSVRDAYRRDASFLVCPRCDDDWLVRHLIGNWCASQPTSAT